MKFFKSVLIFLLIAASLMFAQPSFADKPKFTKNPDYIEVTKELNNLLNVKDTQAQADTSTSEATLKKIDELEFQKYVLEAGIDWGQCRNETGKTLAVYGPKPDEDDDDGDNYKYDNALYFLDAGKTTKNKWDCDGVYLPSDVRTTGISPDGPRQELVGPVAVKIADGTQVVVKTNPDTGAVEFSIPPTKVFKAGELNWFIPNVSQALIDTRVANAPTAKIADENKLAVRVNPESAVDEFNITPKTQPQPESQPQSQPKSQPQPEAQLKQILPKPSFYLKK